MLSDAFHKYPTHDDKKAFWRLPTLYKTVQQKNIADKVHEKFPLILTSGRLTEYEGGGEETRSNPWLAELQQEAFVEINPQTATERGITNGGRVWLSSPTGARLNVQAHGDRACRHQYRVDAVPFLGPLARCRHAGVLPGWCAPSGAW